MPHRSLLLLVLLFMGAAASLQAHTTPTLVVEAEFSKLHGITLHVNVDPRLFLAAAQPASVPPVPPSWWFEQGEEAQKHSQAEVRAYIAKTLTFTVDGHPLHPEWKVVPIDSNTILPLAQTSAEAHLLCVNEGSLPENSRAFQVAVSDSCKVDVILLNSVEGDEHRFPQALFPGEKSSKFTLPGAEAKTTHEEAAPPSANAKRSDLWAMGASVAALLFAAGLVWWLRRRPVAQTGR